MNIFSDIKKKQCIKEYQKLLAKQNFTFAQWYKEQPAISLEAYSNAAVLYGDYIRQDSADEQKPVFLPDFSPNRWDYEDYLGEAVYVRKDIYDAINWDKTSRRAGLKQIMAKEAKAGRVPAVHVRGILEGDVKGYVKLDKRATKGSFEHVRPEEMEQAYQDGISVIIPSKDHPELVKKCVQSLIDTTECPLEVIIVDNGSVKEHRVHVEAMCEFMYENTKGRVKFQYLYEPMEFNFSKMCNMGAAKADGAYLLFLNDDVEAVETGWLEAMLWQAHKDYTGAVGMKLLYPDKERIQHAGIVNLPMGPVHKMQFLLDKEVYYDKRNRGVHNVCAVTGACLMMKKDLYDKLGGMREDLPVAFNDVELCFHAMKEGYHNVACLQTYMIHHESISRGQDNTEEKRGRLLRERSKLYELHPEYVSFDAFYPYDTKTGYGLNHAYLDTSIAAAYEDGRSLTQVAKKLSVYSVAEATGVFTQKKEHEALNPCLKFEVEQLYQEDKDTIHIAGYGFVIGSDNASFAHTLILKGEDKVYSVDLDRVPRNDLERNMPDQEHVGLSGFHVAIPMAKMEKGRYRIELFTKDKASTLRLRQTSYVFMNIGDYE